MCLHDTSLSVRLMRLLVVIALTVIVTLLENPGAQAGADAGAQLGSEVGDWVQTPIQDPALRVFTPSSGALLALTATDLYRSDDAGATWRPIPLPPLTRRDDKARVVVDPSNHDHLYAVGDAGVFEQTAGSDWKLILQRGSQGECAHALAASAADPRLVYVVLGGSLCFDRLRLLKSTDGGASWQEVFSRDRPPASTCMLGVDLLSPHPTDGKRVFFSAGCGQGFSIASGHALFDSHDQGTTAGPAYIQPGFFPSRLVGGAGADRARFYLTEVVPQFGGSGALLRSDHDGQSWQEVGDSLWDLSAPVWARRSWISALAIDPSSPDHVYISLAGQPDGVWASQDGGHTWQDLGLRGLGGHTEFPGRPTSINDLAVGVDGKNLYAATVQGVWVLPLSGPPGENEHGPDESQE